MKAIMLSINPKWVEKIASGEKTVEVRKTAPKEVPFKSYIYSTKGKQVCHLIGCDISYFGCGKVVGEYICNKVDRIPLIYNDIYEDCLQDFLSDRVQKLLKQSCLTHDEIVDYLLSNDELFAKPHEACFEHISDLVIYDESKDVSEFYRPCPEVEIECENCKYSVNIEMTFSTISVGCKRRLTRPFQSWGYVEKFGGIK